MKTKRDDGCGVSIHVSNLGNDGRAPDGELLCGEEKREKLTDEVILMLGKMNDRQLHIVHRFIERLLK